MQQMQMQTMRMLAAAVSGRDHSLHMAPAQVPTLHIEPLQRSGLPTAEVGNLHPAPPRRTFALEDAAQPSKDLQTLLSPPVALEKVMSVGSMQEKLEDALDSRKDAKETTPSNASATRVKKRPASAMCTSSRPSIDTSGAPVRYKTGVIYTNLEKKLFRVYPNKDKSKTQDFTVKWKGDKNEAWETALNKVDMANA